MGQGTAGTRGGRRGATGAGGPGREPPLATRMRVVAGGLVAVARVGSESDTHRVEGSRGLTACRRWRCRCRCARGWRLGAVLGLHESAMRSPNKYYIWAASTLIQLAARSNRVNWCVVRGMRSDYSVCLV